MEIVHTKSHIELVGDFVTLSSAPFNGGVREAKRIINHRTRRSRKGPIEEFFRRKLSASADELEAVVGFITAADVGHAFVDGQDWGDRSVKVVLTAGVGDPVDPRYHNTINVMVYTDVNLTVTGMANLFIVITEAKVSALAELEVVKNGEEITGTPTDAVAVARPSTPCGNDVDFSGTATKLGQATYRLVKRGVREALQMNNGYNPDRNILSRLGERGISKHEIVEAAFELVVGEESAGELKEGFVQVLEHYSKDPNIHFLISSGFYLEKEKKRFGLPGDPGRLIADELIGINIAEYIGGKNALFNFTRYDREKPGILGALSPFLDDVVGGLIAGCMTKLFEKDPTESG